MAALHPQIVHFAIALLIVGVVLRVISLVGRPAFVSPAATTLLLLGTVAAVLAVQSGDAAHGPVERMPGVRAIVEEHELWGERARIVFLGVAALELVALGLWWTPRRKVVHVTAALVGIAGLWVLYQAGDHGGRIVYSYAGGVGIRSGETQDVGRLLLAGLYHQAQLDRQAGRSADAAVLIDEAFRRFGSDPEVQMLAAESALLDRQESSRALTLLQAVVVPADRRALRIRHGLLMADALAATGQRDGAAAVLRPLADEFPTNARIKERLEALRRDPSAH